MVVTASALDVDDTAISASIASRTWAKRCFCKHMRHVAVLPADRRSDTSRSMSAEAFDDRAAMRFTEPDLHRREAGLLRASSTGTAYNIDRRGSIRSVRAAPNDRRRRLAMAETDRPQLHHQFRAAASGGARRAAPRAGARRRGRRARRSAYRPAASRHREADRAQDLSAGDALFRPARLRRADEPGACLLPRGREAARPRGAAARAADPRALLRDRPAPVAPPQRHHAGDGRRRAHPAAVGLRGAREADGVLRARLGLRACTRPISAPAACTRTCRRS